MFFLVLNTLLEEFFCDDDDMTKTNWTNWDQNYYVDIFTFFLSTTKNKAIQNKREEDKEEEDKEEDKEEEDKEEDKEEEDKKESSSFFDVL